MGFAGKLSGGEWEAAVVTGVGGQRTKRQRSDVRDQMSEGQGKRRRSGIRHRMSEIGGQRAKGTPVKWSFGISRGKEVGDQTSDVRDRRAKGRGQKSEIGNLREK